MELAKKCFELLNEDYIYNTDKAQYAIRKSSEDLMMVSEELIKLYGSSKNLSWADVQPHVDKIFNDI